MNNFCFWNIYYYLSRNRDASKVKTNLRFRFSCIEFNEYTCFASSKNETLVGGNKNFINISKLAPFNLEQSIENKTNNANTSVCLVVTAHHSSVLVSHPFIQTSVITFRYWLRASVCSRSGTCLYVWWYSWYFVWYNGLSVWCSIDIVQRFVHKQIALALHLRLNWLIAGDDTFQNKQSRYFVSSRRRVLIIKILV